MVLSYYSEAVWPRDTLSFSLMSGARPDASVPADADVSTQGQSRLNENVSVTWGKSEGNLMDKASR